MIKYLLQVRKALPLMQRVIQACRNGGRISFEGDISKVDLADIPGIEWRSSPGITSAPETREQNRVSFPLNAETSSLLLQDLLNRIGLRKNIWRITIEQGGALVFAAYDKFGADCVWISDIVGGEFIESLKRDRIISEYRVNPYSAA